MTLWQSCADYCTGSRRNSCLYNLMKLKTKLLEYQCNMYPTVKQNPTEFAYHMQTNFRLCCWKIYRHVVGHGPSSINYHCRLNYWYITLRQIEITHLPLESSQSKTYHVHILYTSLFTHIICTCPLVHWRFKQLKRYTSNGWFVNHHIQVFISKPFRYMYIP